MKLAWATTAAPSRRFPQPSTRIGPENWAFPGSAPKPSRIFRIPAEAASTDLAPEANPTRAPRTSPSRRTSPRSSASIPSRRATNSSGHATTRWSRRFPPAPTAWAGPSTPSAPIPATPSPHCFSARLCAPTTPSAPPPGCPSGGPMPGMCRTLGVPFAMSPSNSAFAGLTSLRTRQNTASSLSSILMPPTR